MVDTGWGIHHVSHTLRELLYSQPTMAMGERFPQSHGDISCLASIPILTNLPAGLDGSNVLERIYP